VSATQDAPELAPEDEARAALYGLIARLFYAPPDQAVLGQIVHASSFEGGDALALAWRELAEASRSAFPVLLEQEHTALFVGTGKSEVTPYLTHYVIRYATDNPLVELRQRLQIWGIGRQGSVSEPEDHVAGVCETMRYAIAVQHRSIEEQKDFFERFLYRGATAFCSAVTASPKATFYRHVAAFAHAFLEIEREAFAMIE
jgi:TorA maturation chaperone TorD